MQPEFIFFTIIILIMSVVIHEVSHGYAAQMLGDPTAKLAGRLTLNPVKHLDPLGSVIIPAILVLTNASFLIGWAKPVPYNPYNLSNARWGEAIVSLAGPLTNFFLALVFGLVLRVGIAGDFLSMSFIEIASLIVYINILLGLFNMLPIPPLDGSKVLKAVLPYELAYKYDQFVSWYTRFGFAASFLFLFVFITILIRPFSEFVSMIFKLITGFPLF